MFNGGSAERLNTMTVARISSTICDQKELESYWTSVNSDGERFDSVDDGVIVTDARGAIRYSNNVANTLTGFNLDQARGQRLADFLTIIDEATRRVIEDPIARCLATNNVVILGNHDVMVRRTGIEIPIAGSATPITNARGKCVGSALVIRDVTPTRLLLRRISYAVPGKGRGRVLTRRQFLQRIEHLLGAMSDIHEHALIMVQCQQRLLDVDKDLGSGAGEALSGQLMRVLQTELREDDLLARLGSDDFGILLAHCPRRQAQWILKRINTALQDYRFNWEQGSIWLNFNVDILLMYGKDYSQTNRFVRHDALVYDEDGRYTFG